LIIWLNGTFGAGKTTTARELARIMPNARLFDPEMVGYLLMEYLKDHDFSDFQELPPWRTLVPVVTSEIARFTGQHLLAALSTTADPATLAAPHRRSRKAFESCPSKNHPRNRQGSLI
jgi:hypothetical protein